MLCAPGLAGKGYGPRAPPWAPSCGGGWRGLAEAPRHLTGEIRQWCGGWEPDDSRGDSRQSAGLPSPQPRRGPAGRAELALQPRGPRPRAPRYVAAAGGGGAGWWRSALEPPPPPLFLPAEALTTRPALPSGGRAPGRGLVDEGILQGRGPLRRGAGVEEGSSFQL